MFWLLIFIVMFLILFVVGLAWATDDMSLREAFSAYGEVHEGMDVNLEQNKMHIEFVCVRSEDTGTSKHVL